MGKIDKYIEALETLGDGRYRYYDGSANSVGCSEYTRQALVKSGIIKSGETFHAASGKPGVLEDTTRFKKIPWSANNLQRGDIMWSNGHHVATWDGKNGVYEASPESTHGICANGKTGVGHWPSHTYYNCGTGTKKWDCIYRIIDQENIEEAAKEAAKEIAKSASNAALDRTIVINALITLLPDIKYGSSGATVKALQIILKKYGWYSDVIDGKAGPNTVKGIKLMQTALGVTADGWVGQTTWKKLLL